MCAAATSPLPCRAAASTMLRRCSTGIATPVASIAARYHACGAARRHSRHVLARSRVASGPGPASTGRWYSSGIGKGKGDKHADKATLKHSGNAAVLENAAKMRAKLQNLGEQLTATPAKPVRAASASGTARAPINPHTGMRAPRTCSSTRTRLRARAHPARPCACIHRRCAWPAPVCAVQSEIGWLA